VARQEMPAKEPHIQCGPGDVAPVVLLPGDPGRIDWIARELEEVEEVASNREFRTITGRFQGVPVSATSTGIGGASTAIAVEELIRIGARILVRVGSAGALQPGMPIGSLVVAEGAVREDGASGMYVPAGYPAVADPELAVALAKGEKKATGQSVWDPEGKRDVPSVLLEPKAIYKENVKDVVADGFVTKEELCTGDYAKFCAEAGIS